MPRDTCPDVERLLRERTARLTPSQRLEEGLSAIRLARELMRAGIRARHPDYDAGQVEDSLARLLWGDELYRRVYPDRELPIP